MTPLPCPFCGDKCTNRNVQCAHGREIHWIVCDGTCEYESGSSPTEAEAIAAHNSIAKAVEAMRALESEPRMSIHHADGCDLWWAVVHADTGDSNDDTALSNPSLAAAILAAAKGAT